MNGVQQWQGPRWQVHVEQFHRNMSAGDVAQRLSALGWEGWEPVGVREGGIGKLRAGTDAHWSVVLKRQIG